MSRSPRVVEVEYVAARLIRVTFTDGLVRELDFDGALHGIFETIDDDSAFALVSVDPVAGTVCWPGGLDLDPDVLHGDHAAVTGTEPLVTREYRLRNVTS